MNLVLVDHMDEVLRQALVVPDPEKFFNRQVAETALDYFAKPQPAGELTTH